MKNKKPVFTYIITILNSFTPSTVLAMLGGALILGTTSEGQSLSFNGLFTLSVIFGYIFCTVISLIYFYLIRRKRITPRWWTNILLILLSYLSIPAHAFAYAKTNGISADRYNESFIVVSLTLEALLLAVVGFFWIGIHTRKPLEKKTPEKKQAKRRYLKFILFPIFYYIAFFGSLLLMSPSHLIGWMARFVNVVLGFPLLSPATNDFISTNFSGQKGHVIFLSNAIIWGVVVWGISRLTNKSTHSITASGDSE